MHTYNLTYNKDLITGKAINASIGVAFFILATMLGAYVRIPVAGSPVPITLQTFFVLLSGAVLGKRLGAASQAGYILLGAAGIPVFQGAACGISYLLGPTGGYIAGFVLAAYVVGYLTRSPNPTMARLIASFSIGSVIIYIFGASWLVYAYKMSAGLAISAGILPFIPGDIAKALAAAVIYSGISKRTGQIFSN